MRNGRFPRSSRGFTLVELMVGVLIGLIGTIVIFQVFAVSESQKRTTAGSSDAQQNGVFSLFQIERDVRMAGYGINHMPLLGCKINGWYEPGGTGFEFKLVPVEIINGAAGAPDVIRLAYGDTDLFMAPAKLTQTMPSPAAVYKVDNRFGFEPEVTCHLELPLLGRREQVRVLFNGDALGGGKVAKGYSPEKSPRERKR